MLLLAIDNIYYYYYYL